MSRAGRLLVFALIAGASNGTLAQVPSPTSNPQDFTRAPAAAYVIQQRHNRLRFEANGAGRRELNLRIRVMDEAAVQAWGQLALTYDSASEDLTLPRVAVQKPDGSVVPSSTGSAQDLAVKPFNQLPIFLDLHQKILAISALRPGDLLIVDAIWSTTHPIIPGQFCFQYTFDTREVVQDEQLEIDVPAAKSVIVRARAGAPPEEHGGAGVVAGDRRVYRWKWANAAVKKKEDGAAQEEEEEAQPPDVRVTTFRTWEEVGRWFTGLLPKGADAAVQAKAAALTKGLTDPAAKIEALYTYVSTQVRYVSLSFGLGRYAPHAPAEVLANQYGDCKDKATLLAALLAAAGIDSVPVLVNSRRSASADVPSPQEFDHMFIVVARGTEPEWLWLDSTTEIAPTGMLGANVRGRKALFVGDARQPAHLVTTPLDPPFPAVDRVDVEGTVDALGVLRARVRQTSRSDGELMLRMVLRRLPREQWESFAQNLAQNMELEGTISDVTAGDPADTHQPIQLSYALRRTGYLDWAAAASDLSPALPVLPLGISGEDDLKGRDHVTLGSPVTIHAHANIEFPPGYAFALPVPVKTANAGLEYESSYRVEGSRLIVDREVRWKTRKIAAADFGAYAAFVRAVQADIKQTVKVRNSASDAVPAVPADATALEVYHAALSAYEAKKYETAVVLWKRTAELDPKMGDAWVSLGLAYEKLEKYDDAAAAIQKQIDLDPFSKRAYGDLGFVQKNAGRPEEAAKAYAKHVELNPLDGDALKALGEIYWDLHRYADAAQTLEKAVSLVKPDGWTFALLGASYLQIGEREKANRALERAVETAPTPAVLTKVAWELAERGAELARAADLAARAEKAVSAETRDLTLDGVRKRHWDLMERLAWSWDAIGWCRFQNGDVASGETYVRAAWKLGGYVAMADHLGQILEKRQHRAEALSMYLTSESLTQTPTERARAGIARLTDRGEDLKVLHDAARLEYARERTVVIPGSWPAGSAEFELVVGTDRRALQARFKSGLEALRPIEAKLRELSYPVEFPDETPLRLMLLAEVVCHSNGTCAVGVSPTFRATTDR